MMSPFELGPQPSVLMFGSIILFLSSWTYVVEMGED